MQVVGVVVEEVVVEEVEEKGSDWLGAISPGVHWEICGQEPA